MSGPADLLGVLCAVTFGWGAWRWFRRFGEASNPIVVIGLSAVVGPGLWMLLLALLGVGWPVWLLVLPSASALIVGLAVPGPRLERGRTPWRWVIPAAAVAAAHAAFLAARPASGWDFRYIWGLKAKVFALAATNDAAWLTWPPNGWHHPAYPPLWPDLIAFGIRLGGTAQGVAAIWDSFFVIALAAACWDNLRDARPHLRLVGAAVGACAPLVFSPEYSGYAEPAVAFLAAVALGALVRLTRGQRRDPPALVSLAAATAGLCLVKNEGMVLALGVALAALWFGTRRGKIIAAFAFVIPTASWQLFLAAAGIAREPRSFDPHAWLASAGDAVNWILGEALSPIPLLLLAWLLAAVALARRKGAPALVALGIWGLGVAAAYLTSMQGTAWQLSTSLDRVLAVPLPAAISLALASRDPVRSMQGTNRTAPREA
jgi:hypothetical protein